MPTLQESARSTRWRPTNRSESWSQTRSGCSPRPEFLLTSRPATACRHVLRPPRGPKKRGISDPDRAYRSKNRCQPSPKARQFEQKAHVRTMKITNPFKRNHMDNITKELAALTARRDALLAKQSNAKIALDRALDARQLHLTDGDINDEQIALKKQAAVDTAASALAGFEIASSPMASRVADAAARLDKETQTAAASKASEKLAGQINILDNLHVKWLEITRQFMVALD